VKRWLNGDTVVAAPAIAVCVAVALAVVVTVLLIYHASCAQAATARDSRFQPNLERTVRYLQNAQHEDGGFAEPGRGEESDFSAWVALALAAAGINPRDQTTASEHWVGGHSAYTFLAERAHNASLTTDFERELLVVDAAGASPHDFGGVDLVGEILGRQIASGINAGAFPHEANDPWTPGVNDTIFAILSLSPIHEPAVEEAIARATRWLEAQQKCDGSWNWNYTAKVGACNPKERRLLSGEERGEVDMTGAAIEALNAVGHADSEGQERALAYLREAERPNGGFSEYLGGREPNVASTAWVVQAMWSGGVNPEEWLTHSSLATQEPLGYLASMQQEDGHIRYEANLEMNGMWMTSYVTPAFTGNPLPIPVAPYEELPLEPPSSEKSGNGGESQQPGGGVISGGGGDGAKLFSRPQPGSKGHTPGGARQRKAQKHDKPRTHKLNPGPARKTPVPTIATASVHRVEKHNRPSHKVKKHDQPSHKGTGGMALSGTGTGGGGQGDGREVKGLLIGAPTDALAPGAPGLRGAGAGENRTSWLVIGIAAAALALALVGAFVELRRPRVIL
jgi:prenyltransferase beta subunit